MRLHSVTSPVRTFLGVVGCLVLIVGILATPSIAEKKGDRVYSFNDQDELIQPKGYREWIYVGTPVTPNELNNGKAAFPEFHNVYIYPEHYKKWKKTGAFPDGTILMKATLRRGGRPQTQVNYRRQRPARHLNPLAG